MRSFQLSLACVASVSNRVIARKLERKQKKGWRGRGGEKRKRLPANPTIPENAPWNFTVRFICKLTARQNRNITNRLPLDYLSLPRHSFFFCSCQSFLDEPREETLAMQAIKSRIVCRVVTRHYVSRTKNKYAKANRIHICPEHGVAFSKELLEWGRTFSDFWGKRVVHIYG